MIKLGVGSNAIHINPIGYDSQVRRAAKRDAITVAILRANPPPVAFVVIRTKTKGMVLVLEHILIYRTIFFLRSVEIQDGLVRCDIVLRKIYEPGFSGLPKSMPDSNWQYLLRNVSF